MTRPRLLQFCEPLILRRLHWIHGPGSGQGGWRDALGWMARGHRHPRQHRGEDVGLHSWLRTDRVCAVSSAWCCCLLRLTAPRHSALPPFHPTHLQPADAAQLTPTRFNTTLQQQRAQFDARSFDNTIGPIPADWPHIARAWRRAAFPSSSSSLGRDAPEPPSSHALDTLTSRQRTVDRTKDHARCPGWRRALHGLGQPLSMTTDANLTKYYHVSLQI